MIGSNMCYYLGKLLMQNSQDLYDALISDIANNPKDVFYINQCIDLIGRKYLGYFNRQILELLPLWAKSAPYAILAMIDNSNTFRLFLDAILKQNNMVDKRLSTQERELIHCLKQALSTIFKQKLIDINLINTHFKNFAVESCDPDSIDYDEELQGKSVSLDKVLVIFMKGNIAQVFPELYDDLFKPLVIFNEEEEVGLYYPKMNEVLILLDLKAYGITSAQWKLCRTIN